VIAMRGVSVVVPTVDREAQLGRALQAIACAARRIDEPAEAIVVDDSFPAARERATEWTVDGLRVRRIFSVDAGQKGPAAARNLGVAAARFDLIAFTDDDARCDLDWLAQGTRPLRANGALAGVEGAVRLDPAEPVDPVRSRLVTNGSGGAFMTASLFVRRDAVAAVGGFRPLLEGDPRWAIPYREDSDLALRVIREVGPIPFEPRAVVFHPPESIDLHRLIRLARYFVVDGAYLRLHPEAVQPVLRQPFARLRIRMATTTVLLTPLLIPRRSRCLATLAMILLSSAVSAQFEAELRAAGVRRSRSAALATTIRRLPRSLLWSLVAGGARLQGEAMLIVGRAKVPPDDLEPRPATPVSR